MVLTKDDFFYQLPPELIAQKPAQPADNCRLMVIDRQEQAIYHSKFTNLDSFIPPHSLFVFNETKVQPARLFGRKASGGKVEILLLKFVDKNHIMAWLHPGVKEGNYIVLKNKEQEIHLKVVAHDKKDFLLEISQGQINLEFLEKYGQTPLPPYIKIQAKEEKIRRWYQPIFAKEGYSVASPTASLHFTPRLLQKLKDKGHQWCFVRLDVGIGTFEPVKSHRLNEHKMHSELYSISHSAAEKLNQARESGQSIIAVGTTVARTLESNFQPNQGFSFQPPSQTKLFIYPPYKFKSFDLLLTNFHLPHSTLLMLVSAFASWPNTEQKFTSFSQSLIGKAYSIAIEKGYRFYSFGDSMLIR